MRQIPGFPQYSATTDGRIWSSKGGGRYLRPAIDRNGYLRVSPCLNGKAYSRPVHALVALAFLGPRPDGEEIRHLDGDPSNNCVENLRYGTHAENVRDKIMHGTNVGANAAKTHCPAGHSYDSENTYQYGGHRICKTCTRDRGAARYAAKVGRIVRRSGGGLRHYF